MPVIQGITLSLFAFAITGFILTFFAPAPDAGRAAQDAYSVAISSGSGLRLMTRAPAGLADRAAQPSEETGYLTASSQTGSTISLPQQTTDIARQLTCDSVTTFAGIEVGTRCGNDSIELAAQD